MVWTLITGLAGCSADGLPWATARDCASCRFIDTSEPDSGWQPPPPIAPIAVAFQLNAAVRGSDGALFPWRYDGFTLGEPRVDLVFGGAPFFYEGDDTDSCRMSGPFTPSLRTCDLPNEDGADLWNSYEGTLALDTNDCAARLDPAVWGPGGRDLFAAFDGMRLGFGYGPITQELLDDWSADSLAEVGGASKLMAVYVAITDPDGTFVGEAWNSGALYDWDSATGELVVDGSDRAVALDTSTFGATFPDGLIWNLWSQWYQDFPLIDFALLDAPGTTTTGDCELPETGDTGGDTDTAAPPPPATDGTQDPTDTPDDTPTDGGATDGPAKPGCGCASTPSTGEGLGALTLVLAVVVARRRRRR